MKKKEYNSISNKPLDPQSFSSTAVSYIRNINLCVLKEFEKEFSNIAFIIN